MWKAQHRPVAGFRRTKKPHNDPCEVIVWRKVAMLL